MPGVLKPVEPTAEQRLIIRAWNLMGGLDWAALPTVADLLGITDIEIFVAQLAAIRDHLREES
ncbi:hypothetical protein [Pseudomonas sp.]|uniref:hypothetical protein n=1 Tax=Pseudomonas sp. TaxID=306 RepID=UPI003F2B25D0